MKEELEMQNALEQQELEPEVQAEGEVEKATLVVEKETSPDIEAEARQHGWKPKEEFDKDPDEWVDAKQFLKNRTYLDQIHSLRKSLNRANEKLDGYERSLNTVEQLITRREELARQQERDRILRERREAIQSGDVEMVERLDEHLEKMKEPLVPKKEQQLPPETRAWIEKHSSNWFNNKSLENIEMMEYASELEKRVFNINRNIRISDGLEMIEAEMRRKYPHRFENPNLDKPRAVESGADTGATSNKKQKYDASKLDYVTRNVAHKLIKKGLYKNMDEYMKDYVAFESTRG